MSAAEITTVAALIVTGLMAGLWFAWMVSVIPGTRRVDDHTYVTTMQTINRAIINPAFIVPFIGTPVVLAAAGILQWQAGNTRSAALLFTAAGGYVVGVLGVTGGGNVPLNNELDEVPLADTAATELRSIRTGYERPWNRFHAARTVANLGVFAVALVAAVDAG